MLGSCTRLRENHNSSKGDGNATEIVVLASFGLAFMVPVAFVAGEVKRTLQRRAERKAVVIEELV